MTAAYRLSALVCLATMASAHAECWVRGNEVTLPDVVVKPPGKPAFRVRLTQLPVRALLPRKPKQAVQLVVEGAVTFQARADRIPIRLFRDVQAAAQSLIMQRGVRLWNAYPFGTQVASSVILDEESFHEEGDKAPNEMLSSVQLPCDFLTLDVIDVEPNSVSLDAEWVEPRKPTKKIKLWLEPKATGRVFELSHASCDRCFQFKRLEAQDGWWLIEREALGVRVKGWVKAGDLRVLSQEEHEEAIRREKGDIAHPDIAPETQAQSEGEYLGVAVVQALAKVYAAPGEGVWATLTQDTEVKVRAAPEAPFIEILSMPGIEGVSKLPAWVDRTEVEFIEADIP